MEDPHIVLEIPDTLPGPLIENIFSEVKEIDHDSLRIAAVKKTSEVWLCFEWAIPGLIVAYIAKAYFEGFLNEAGKDHYVRLTNWLKKLLQRARGLNVVAVASSDKKLDPANSQSKAVSVFLFLKNGQYLKLLFDNELSQNEWENGVEKIVKMVIDHYEDSETSILSKELNALRGMPYAAVYCYIDRESKTWKFIDDLRLAQNLYNPSKKDKERKKQKSKKHKQ